MQLKQLIAIVAVMLLVTSCKKDVEAEAVPQEVVNDTLKPVPVASDKDPILQKHIAAFIKRKEATKAELTKLNPQQANNLFDRYVVENGQAIVAMDSIESHLLENFYTYFTDERGNPKTPPDSIARKEKLLKSAGLELWEIGEGYVEIRTQPNFYLDIFKDHVTADYKSYLTIVAEDDKDLYSADAGIAISFKAVGQRVVNWENFIAKYPNSKLIEDAKTTYSGYQADYLFGQDNTPTMQDNSTKLFPENEAEIRNFISKYPDSFTTKLAKIVLGNNTLNRDQLRTLIANEQEKYLLQK
ncbi:hypothetical protein FMM05_02015 [Flavobacterium zepuense]|uniref:Lipoprotein n=1 Tax=Flavobacterium zepuense TaxID=2593302 RepID=A0A552VAC6_9FLAO|nr:hypothetical protein [Flavobacterium zepuense]TRW27437.1 hypothetical protein FMM05_02015 [Flavobacterium zepuense]